MFCIYFDSYCRFDDKSRLCIWRERLHKAGFIKGMSDSAMALNESEPLTREQLASIILEINALKDVALIVNLSSQYSDTDEISDWARPLSLIVRRADLCRASGITYLPLRA